MHPPDTESILSSVSRDRVDATPSTESLATIEVVAEQLHVGKRIVDTGGGVRLHKHVLEEPVRVDVRLARQEVSVERVAVGRDVDGPVDVRWEGDVMVVPVVEERLVWRKQLVLVEELRVTRANRIVDVSQATTLRREEVVVERFDGAAP